MVGFGADAVAVFKVDGAAFVEGVGGVGEDLLPFADAVFADAGEEVPGFVFGPFAAGAAGFVAFFGGGNGCGWSSGADVGTERSGRASGWGCRVCGGTMGLTEVEVREGGVFAS